MCFMKIDAHTHIGIDKARERFGLPYNCDPDILYSLSLSNGISDVIVSPAPGQIVCPHLGEKNHPNFYGTGGLPTLLGLDKTMKFRCGCGVEWETDDPFKEINDYLFRTVEVLNSYETVRFHPLPIVHPFKKTVDQDIRTYYKKYGIRGVKIHSLIDGINPKTYIDSEFSYTLKRLGLRVLFHTDVTDNAHPSSVLDFAEETGIYCQLAHGCRGDYETLDRISKFSNVIVDVSPINLIHEKKRLLSKKDFCSYNEFIEYMIKYATEKKIVVGSDFFWCGWTEESFNNQWNFFDKFGNDNLNYKNAKEFWGI